MNILLLNLNNLLPVLVTIFCSFIITVILVPRFIPILHRFKFGQEERDDGPESHLKKRGTPTMGGIAILIAVFLSTMVGMSMTGGINQKSLQILFLTFACGVVGFADDYLKVKRHDTKGLSPPEKIFAQGATTLIFVVWLYFSRASDGAGSILIPFSRNSISLPIWLFIPFALFITIGTDNGVNFSDGLDGLSASVTLIVTGMYIAVGIMVGEIGAAIVSSAMFGSLLGFVLFNAYPAKIFMGDTGSLGLGGFTSATAFVLGVELYLPVFGFIYMLEVISVIIQVVYFKKTHGKRFFKMAPIHHHFELNGHSEPRVVAAFTVVTLLLCLVSFAGILM